MPHEVKAAGPAGGALVACAALAMALVVGCARLPDRGAGTGSAAVGRAGPAATPAPPPTAQSARVLHIDPARSLLTIRAYRGGTLAAAGHNHVLAAHDLEGEVTLAQPLAASRVRLGFAVARLGIDEPALRAAAGADFAAEVPESAREGTRRNLLGAALLDGEHFPRIELESTAVTPTPEGLRLVLRARVRDHDASFEVPVALEQRGDALVARGALELRQSELGLVPFSVMLGALQVQDTLRLQFEVFAAP